MPGTRQPLPAARVPGMLQGEHDSGAPMNTAIADTGAQDGKLRRFVAHPLVLLVIGAIMVVAATIGSSALAHLVPHGPGSVWPAFGGLIVALAVILTYKAFKRWIERASDRELELHGALGELCAGLLLGFLIFSAATGVVALLGGFEILGLRGAGNIWPMIALAFVSGPFEEILFRGLVLRLLEKLVGTWWALAATSAFFGLAHLMNPDSTLFAAFAIACEAGILLGAAYLVTRRLWLAIGLHSAWNFTQGWVFSIPVSGGTPPLGLLITRRVGPEWLTGGDFGLEASAVALVVATVAGFAMLWVAHRRAPFVLPRWRRTQTKL